MNSIQRQLLSTQRRRTAADAAAQTPTLRDEPIERTDVLRRGIAKIDSNEGEGAYKVTELWWDPQEQEWTRATAPLGLEEADASDYMGSGCGGVDQIVRFWEHRGLGGQIQRFVDVSGGGDTVQKLSSFCVHYSGSDTTAAFHSVTDCKNAMLEVGIDLRRCSGHTSSADHPGSTAMALTGGFLGFGWCNALATWSGGNWANLKYTARGANGGFEGDGTNAITNFHIQCRVTAGGSLDFRVENLTGGLVSAVIVAAMRVTPFPEAPGVIEIGNCCWHDGCLPDHTDDWNEYEWGEIP